MGWEHDGKTQKHESQVDYSKGFGGKFGVEKDKQDKSALGFDHVGKLAKHESQTDYRFVENRIYFLFCILSTSSNNSALDLVENMEL